MQLETLLNRANDSRMTLLQTKYSDGNLQNDPCHTHDAAVGLVVLQVVTNDSFQRLVQASSSTNSERLCCCLNSEISDPSGLCSDAPPSLARSTFGHAPV